MITCFARLAIVCLASLCLAQGPPPTKIFLLEYDAATEKVGALTTPDLPKGYNNQPFWCGDGSLMFTGIYEDGQADSYRYEPKTGKLQRLLWSQESEYSPTLTPDGTSFSTIRVEHDGSQRLWRFPLEGGAGSLILRTIKPVGYHLWLDNHRLALFVLGEPHTLYVVDKRDESTTKVFGNVGRCFAHIPAEAAFSAVQANADGVRTIQKIDKQTLKVTEIVQTLEGSEDYVWTMDGTLLMGKESKLFAYRPSKDTTWRELADLAPMGIKGITRMALSADNKTLAVVGND